MDEPDRIVIESSRGTGCGVVLSIILLAFAGYWFSQGFSKAELIITLICLPLIAIVYFHRVDIVFDKARRKLVRSQRGLIPNEKEFDLDQCSVRVKTANDSGIFHAVSIVATVNNRNKEIISKREIGREGFQNSREKAKEWALLMDLPAYEDSFGDPIRRDPENLPMPLMQRCAQQALSAPPPNAAIPVSHVDGMMVFDLGKSRQKIYIGNASLKIATDIYVTTISKTVPLDQVMELEFERRTHPVKLILLTSDAIIGLGAALPIADQEWLRDALRFALAELGDVKTGAEI
jgi:hypothetical protein